MPSPDAPTAPAATRSTTTPRLDAIDGFRGLCALAVFVFHGWLYTMPTPAGGNRSGVIEYVVHELRIGLVAFFVLSGFLLYRPFLKAALDAGERVDLRKFARSRTMRIAPAYYVCLLACVALLWSVDGTPGVRLPPIEELPLFLVFAQNLSENSVMTLDPPMWSLAVEVTFYLSLPLLGLMAARLPRTIAWQAVVPVGMIVVGLAYNWMLVGEDASMPYYRTLLTMAYYFGAGMLGALALHALRGRAAKRPWRGTLLAGGIALVAVHVAMTTTGAARIWDSGDLYVVARDMLAAAGFTMILVALASARRVPVLGHPVLVGLGTISYGFYLWHVPVLLFMRGHGLLPMDPLWGTIAALAPSLLIAWASWVLVERRAIAWGGRRNAAASDGDGGGRTSREVAVRA